MPVRDGLGQPLDPEALYYVQDTRQIVGNCALWWRMGAKGYTCDLDEAGAFTGAYVAALSAEHIPWPVAHVTARVVRHVRAYALRKGGTE